MVVMVLERVAASLRGDLTRWARRNTLARRSVFAETRWIALYALLTPVVVAGAQKQQQITAFRLKRRMSHGRLRGSPRFLLPTVAAPARLSRWFRLGANQP